MIIEAEEPDTGKTVQLECVADSEDDIRDLLSFDFSEEALKKRLDALAISADAKSVLFTIAKSSIRVGTMVVKIGRKVLDVITTVLTEFPGASTGVIFGAVFGLLVSSIPVIGLVLGPFLGPLAIAFGFAAGAMQDFGNKALERRVMSKVAAFDALKPKV